MRNRGHRSSLGFIAMAVAVAALALSAPSAFAADITGTWDMASPDIADQTWTFTAGTGTLAGSGAGGPYTWPMEGTISGNAVQIKTTYNELPSYTAYLVGTVSADGTTMSGTWSTSGFDAAATSTLVWAGTRRGAAPGPAPQPAVKPAGVQVICNRGPDPDSLFTCTATVGGTTAPPTGSVKWSAGKGGFPLGDTCTLAATPLSPNVASCTVTWNPGVGGFPAGVAPPVTATYQGDAKSGAASGAPQLYGIASFDPKLPPNLCAFNASCDGIDVLASGKAKLNAKTGQLAKLTAGCYGSGTGAKTAARVAQAPVFSCGVSAEAVMSAAGNAEVEALLARADKLLSSGNKQDQLKGQQLVQQANKKFGEIVKALEASGDILQAGLDLSFDEAMAKATKLLASPKPADQLAGQKLVQAANKKINSDIQTLQQRSQQLAKAIGSSVRRRRTATLATARVKVAGGRRGTLNLAVAPKQRRILIALRRAGIRSVTLRLQLSAVRSGAQAPVSTLTTLKVALR